MAVAGLQIADSVRECNGRLARLANDSRKAGHFLIMDTETFLKNLGIFAVVFTTIAGFIGWMIKGLITHYLSLDVEDYKKKLNTETLREIEQFKSDLQNTNKEKEIRFSKLHEKRAEAIQTIYGQLSFLVMLSELLVPLLENVNTCKEESTIKLCDSYHGMMGEVVANMAKYKILLSDKTIDSIFGVVISKYHPFMNKDIRGMYLLNPEEVNKRIESMNLVKIETPKIMNELRAEFRAILGLVE